MEYKIIVKDGSPIKLEFRPSPVSSNGYCNQPLMEKLINEFHVPGWSYHKEGILSFTLLTFPPLLENNYLLLQNYTTMVKEAQDYITKLMDEAMRQQSIARALESPNK